MDLSNPWLLLIAAAAVIIGPKVGLGWVATLAKGILDRVNAAKPAPVDPVPLTPVPDEPSPDSPVLPKLLDLIRLVLARRAGVQADPDGEPDELLVKWLEEKLHEEAAK